MALRLPSGGGRGTTIGILGDSAMQQLVDAIGCELRRLGAPERAGFLKWERVLADAGSTS